MTEVGELRSLQLTDGRLLSYREYGAADGFPVINCHGGLLCGSDIAPAHGAAETLGLRLISPDRPGIGYSTVAPGRTTGSWAADVTQLLDHLQLRDVAAYGWSLGGQYALALAALVPEVKRVVVVAGTPELDDELLAQLNRLDRTLVGMAKNQPLLMRTLTAATGTLAHHLPELLAKATDANLSPSDREALEDWPASAFAACMAHALRQSEGMVEEYLVESRPWGFTLDQVRVPATLWQGTEDQLVPPQWVEILAAALPDARVNVVAGAGHFVAYDRWAEVLAGALPADGP